MADPSDNQGAKTGSGDPTWAWSLYWQADRLQSCMPVDDPAAADDLLAAWKRFFGQLSSAARLLDLGTGNGVVAAQAVLVSRTKTTGFEIHGVDLAAIDPSRFASSAAELLGQVRFHPGTAMEALPFPDAHFDAVCGQYALEYSKTAKSVPEILRVLRPDSPFRFLLHADDGVLKGRSRMQRLQAETILGTPLFAHLRAALDGILAAESQGTPEVRRAAEKTFATFTGTLHALDQGFAGAEDRSLPDNLLAAARRLPNLRRSHDRAALLALADDIEERLKAQAARLSAMEGAALDGAETEALGGLFRAAGAAKVNIEPATVGPGKTPVGRWLSGRSG